MKQKPQMLMNAHFVRIMIVVLLSVSFCTTLFAAQFYVYKDKYGRTHIEDSVTGEAAKYGYKVVNDNGMTLKKVASIAVQEKKAMKIKVAGDSRRDSEIRKQRRDELRYRFGSLEEIREIGNKKIIGFQVQIDTTLSYIKSFEDNLKVLEAQAQAHSDNQQPVPQQELKAIKQAKNNIQQNLQYIDQRRIDQRKIRDEYMVLIDEYKEYMSIDD